MQGSGAASACEGLAAPDYALPDPVQRPSCIGIGSILMLGGLSECWGGGGGGGGGGMISFFWFHWRKLEADSSCLFCSKESGFTSRQVERHAAFPHEAGVIRLILGTFVVWFRFCSGNLVLYYTANSDRPEEVGHA